MSDFNPYAAPESKVVPDEKESGCWQDGPLLVLTKDAVLPDRCVKCNDWAEGSRLVRKLSWHRPAWYILLLISIPVYVIVALIVRQTAKIRVGLCARHRSARRRAIAVGWLSALAGIATIVLGASDVVADVSEARPYLIVGGIVAILFGLIYGMFGSQVVTPNKIDKRFVWLNKVHPEYLATLPAWTE